MATGTIIDPFIKDPDSIRTFGVSWATHLGADTLSTSAWAVISGTVVIDTSTSNTTTATVKLSGGTEGEVCKLRNRVTTAAGETIDQTVYVRIKQQ